MRKHFSRTERTRLFQLHNRECHICGQQIKVGDGWDLEHIVPWALTRDDSDGNVKPAHKSCHKEKTADDQRIISKVKRVKAKHEGTFPPSLAKIKSRGFAKTRNFS
ncbi:HNH endonuclease protein [Rhizobium phage RHph_Y1_10]|nr:HNH endonuclease protein [Rhizobium phage RHph_Y1_10]